MSKLYSEFERSREAVWAHQEDVKALDALRARLNAETEMAENVTQLRKKAQPSQ